MIAPTTTKTSAYRARAWRAWCLGILVVLFCWSPLSATSVARAAPTNAADGRFDAQPCTFKDVPANDSSVLCGYLTVPERHAEPDGKTIQLAVVIYKATNATATEPLVMAQGGPGGSTISTYASLLETGDLAPLRRNRDVVLFDQRGTLNSKPALTCPELIELTDQTIEQQLSYEESNQRSTDALLACRARLANEGINLAAFNSLENAADIDSLRAALGYQKINLYGVSYGTLLALHTMRNFPDALRSVIIDGVVPTQERIGTGSGRTFNRSLDQLFSTCAAEPSCKASYPDLEQVFWQLVDQFDKNPPRVRITDSETKKSYNAVLDGETFYGLIFQLFYVTQALPALPKIIYDARAGQFDLLAQIWPQFAFERDIAEGMYFSVACAEDTDFKPEDINLDGIRSQIAERERRDDRDFLTLCTRWNVPQLDSAVNQPVSSDIPTLIFNGQFDPVTPPPDGEEAAQTLSHSYSFTFPGNGHGALTGDACATAIAQAFLADPQVKPDGSCVAAEGPPDYFTSANTAFTPAIGRLFNNIEVGNYGTIALLLGGALLLLLVFIGWPLAWLIQRMRGTPAETRRLAKAAPWLVVLLAVIAWLFIVALIAVIFTVSANGGDLQLLLGLPRGTAWLLVLPPVIALLTVGVIGLAVLAWEQGFWGVGRRIFYTLLALAAVGLSIGLYQTGLLLALITG